MQQMTNREMNPAQYFMNFKFKTKKKMIEEKKEYYFWIKVEEKIKKQIMESN